MSRRLTEAEAWDACAKEFESEARRSFGICHKVWSLLNTRCIMQQVGDVMLRRLAAVVRRRHRALGSRYEGSYGWPPTATMELPDRSRIAYCRRQAARCRREEKRG